MEKEERNDTTHIKERTGLLDTSGRYPLLPSSSSSSSFLFTISNKYKREKEEEGRRRKKGPRDVCPLYGPLKLPDAHQKLQLYFSSFFRSLAVRRPKLFQL